MKNKVLVTGGAGYIGSFIVRQLQSEGYEPVIVDNLVAGHKEAIEGFTLEKLDIYSEKDKLNEVFQKHQPVGVIHMASYIQMGESFKDPSKYFHHNLETALNILDAMVGSNVKYFVFSSSAGVYGSPKEIPIKETDLKNPENPYGETKLMIERFLHWYEKAHDIKYMSIRYFNAAGAALDGSIGEDHPAESHLIPILISKAMSGQEATIYGGDYGTKDGTNVRDYIHVLDLAEAHTIALKALREGQPSESYNCGTGVGYSNKEIVNMINKVTGLELRMTIGPRRPGDADSLVADVGKIKQNLGWSAKLGLEDIIKSAYAWHKSHPKGYES